MNTKIFTEYSRHRLYSEYLIALAMYRVIYSTTTFSRLDGTEWKVSVI